MRGRDRREKRPYEDLIASRTRLLQECQQRERTQEKMQQQMSIQTQELSAVLLPRPHLVIGTRADARCLRLCGHTHTHIRTPVPQVLLSFWMCAYISDETGPVFGLVRACSRAFLCALNHM